MDLKKFLTSMDKLMFLDGTPPNQKGWNYRSTYHFVASEGFQFTHPETEPMGMEKKQCFKNAFEVVMMNPKRFIYCEGFAHGVIPIMHAWVYDRYKKCIRETCWDEPGETYLGVPFDWNYVRKIALESKYYGIIDAWSIGWPVMKSHPVEFLHDDFIKKIKNKG